MSTHGFTPERTETISVLFVDPSTGGEEPFWTAPYDCEVLSISERHATAGTDGSAVTAHIEKLADGTAAAGGTTVMNGTFNMKATANTLQWADLSATLADRQLTRGDSLGIDFTGTLTSLASVSLTILVKILMER
ncbi:MAG: hypothetical protein C4523_08830 [Myxococcales bacterium]|nr:MAG: hypothetical protein C4523_08830 [Myxococcales bacterium]